MLVIDLLYALKIVFSKFGLAFELIMIQSRVQIFSLLCVPKQAHAILEHLKKSREEDQSCTASQ